MDTEVITRTCLNIETDLPAPIETYVDFRRASLGVVVAQVHQSAHGEFDRNWDGYCGDNDEWGPRVRVHHSN